MPTEPLARRLAATVRLRVTWQASALYAVAFGGYVAFSVYLPTYLKTAYGLTQADAANRMAGFVLLAVAMRPIGGWLSDRIGPVRVLAGSLRRGRRSERSCSRSRPALAPLGTVAFLSMAAALGAASGATFALVALLAPAEQGRLGHRHRRRRRRPRRLRAAAGDGLAVRPYGTYAAGLAAPRGRGSPLALAVTAVAKNVSQTSVGVQRQATRPTSGKGSTAHV